jgi:hypothetical protein
MEMLFISGLFERFAMLWNNYVMGRLAAVPGLGLLAQVRVIAANLVAFPVDSMLRQPSLASHYATLLVKS